MRTIGHIAFSFAGLMRIDDTEMDSSSNIIEDDPVIAEVKTLFFIYLFSIIPHLFIHKFMGFFLFFMSIIRLKSFKKQSHLLLFFHLVKLLFFIK